MSSIAAIIVNYNYGRYISDAIDSVISQTDPFDEIIVVDDGSTDNSASIISKYEGKVHFIRKTNGGQLSASIAGLAASRSDYVYILDADDFVDTGLVSSLRSLLDTNPTKVQFQLSAVNANRGSLGSTFPTYPENYDSAAALQDNAIEGTYIYPPTSGNVYRRETLAALDLSRLDMHEPVDGSPALAMSYFGSIISINSPLGYYRVHGDNVSQWGQPSVALLTRELTHFHKRWEDVCAFAGLEAPPFGTKTPLYVLQRQLMMSALTEGKGVSRLSFQYFFGLPASARSWKQKVMLMAWAAALLAPVPSLRRYLVFALRSPAHRPKWLR